MELKMFLDNVAASDWLSARGVQWNGAMWESAGRGHRIDEPMLDLTPAAGGGAEIDEPMLDLTPAAGGGAEIDEPMLDLTPATGGGAGIDEPMLDLTPAAGIGGHVGAGADRARIALMNTPERGSCHCGAICFELALDRGMPGLRCNCSYCLKVRSWAVIVPADQFRLIRGDDSLSTYAFGPHRECHHFCRACGVRMFGRGAPPGKPAYVTVNLACLDSLSPEELAALPIRYVDGKHDRWDDPPAVTRHL